MKILSSGMVVPILIQGDKSKFISEFFASLVYSMFQVNKSLGPGMVAYNFNHSTFVWDFWVQVSLLSYFHDSQI